MASTLLLYSTTDGHTIKICERILATLEAESSEVTLKLISEVSTNSLNSFDKIVIGASIRYGKHQKEVYNFVRDNKTLLESKPSAFFTVNLVARKPNKNTPETNPYIQKFLQQTNWKPTLCGVFAGKVHYQKYSFLNRLMIRFIMYVTKGPTNPDAEIEFTNWEAVEDFAKAVLKQSSNP